MLLKQNLFNITFVLSSICFFHTIVSNTEEICEICERKDNRPLRHFDYNSSPDSGIHIDCIKTIVPCVCNLFGIFSKLNIFEREQFHKIYMHAVQQEVRRCSYDSILSFYEAQGMEQLTVLFNTVGAAAAMNKLTRKIDDTKEKQSVDFKSNNLLAKRDGSQENKNFYYYEEKLKKFNTVKKELEQLCNTKKEGPKV